ncbi:MAG: acylphosphatase [Pseudomonadota bacterium]|nr:acylphosphatase [Pseudomonadota bacterium]
MKNKSFNIFFKIFGRVQGVGYRVWTKRVAMKYSLNGWVKNCNDKTVECEVNGGKEEINNFVRECHKGPMLSSVKKILREERPNKQYKSFIILYK